MSSSSDSNNNNIEEIMTKFIETKIKIEELEKKYEKYRKSIEHHMMKEDLEKIEHYNPIDGKKYKLKKMIMSRETISKKELPKEIWDKYCKSSTYSMIRLTKSKS